MIVKAARPNAVRDIKRRLEGFGNGIANPGCPRFFGKEAERIETLRCRVISGPADIERGQLLGDRGTRQRTFVAEPEDREGRMARAQCAVRRYRAMATDDGLRHQEQGQVKRKRWIIAKMGGEDLPALRRQLVDQNGQPITEEAFRGKPTALFFGFTHCPEVCPTTLFELDGWLKQVDPNATGLQAYFVTVDPERDTPEILGRYISNVTDRITGIAGDPAKIAEVVKGFRVYAKKIPLDEAQPDGDYTMDHTASIFLLDADGRFKGTIAYGENPDTAIKKLENLMKG